ETELWPGLFAAATASGVPLVLVSARLYPRDVARYAAVRPFWRGVPSPATRILAQDAAERAAFLRIGADPGRIVIGGNLKYDAPVAPARAAGARDHVPVVVGASTHDPEERLLLREAARLHHDGIS